MCLLTVIRKGYSILVIHPTSRYWVYTVHQKLCHPMEIQIPIKYNPCPQRAPGGKNINTKLQVTVLHIIKEVCRKCCVTFVFNYTGHWMYNSTLF